MEKTLITSIGRTATVSLSNYLNSVEDVVSFHERKKSDIPILFLSQIATYKNIVTNYCYERFQEEDRKGINAFVEVNPYLRFIPKTLLKELNWNRIAIVRHPRTYLESVYKRSLFRERDILLQQVPSDDDPIADNWFSLSRFQKLCWYYGRAHTFFLKEGDVLIQFEKLTTTTSTLQKLLQEIGSKTNIENDFSLPHLNKSDSTVQKVKRVFKGDMVQDPLEWDTLTTAEIEFYERYCIAVARKMGYDV